MDDVLFVGPIPKEYHYCVWSSDYVTLYNRPDAQNITLPYYRIYFNAPGFHYSRGTQTFSQYQATTFQDINVSDKWYYRKDSLNILMFTFIIGLCTLWLVNLMTSIFKKGGLLGGLF